MKHVKYQCWKGKRNSNSTENTIPNWEDENETRRYSMEIRNGSFRREGNWRNSHNSDDIARRSWMRLGKRIRNENVCWWWWCRSGWNSFTFSEFILRIHIVHNLKSELMGKWSELLMTTTMTFECANYRSTPISSKSQRLSHNQLGRCTCLILTSSLNIPGQSSVLSRIKRSKR